MSYNHISEIAELSGDFGRLEQALRATNTLVWEVDLEEDTVEYFGSVQQITGLPTSELGEPLSNVHQTIHPADQSRVLEQLDPLVEGNTNSLEAKYRTHPDNGPIRWIQTEAFIEESEDEASTKLVGLSTDITEQKEYEVQLEAFVSVISHDLRNPLSVANGHLELARDECTCEHLDYIAEAHTRMETLIEDLLSLARENQDIGELDAVDLAGLVEDCWRTIETGDARLVVESDQIIQADTSRFKQLLENLFRNAIDHGGGDVTVTIGDLGEGFYVEDDGIGIPADERDQFFQRKTAPGRTGIGLGIVKQIVDAHEWEICVTEGETGGARFEITDIQPA